MQGAFSTSLHPSCASPISGGGGLYSVFSTQCPLLRIPYCVFLTAYSHLLSQKVGRRSPKKCAQAPPKSARLSAHFLWPPQVKQNGPMFVAVVGARVLGLSTSGVDAWETARRVPGAAVWFCRPNSEEARLVRAAPKPDPAAKQHEAGLRGPDGDACVCVCSAHRRVRLLSRRCDGRGAGCEGSEEPGVLRLQTHRRCAQVNCSSCCSFRASTGCS
eukprot:COSAG04_NODE_2428_length_4141_cov_2.330777_5_plen_216_part_00